MSLKKLQSPRRTNRRPLRNQKFPSQLSRQHQSLLVSGTHVYDLTNERHEWYQTDQYVFVDIFFKNIPKDKCSVDIEPHSVIPSNVLPNVVADSNLPPSNWLRFYIHIGSSLQSHRSNDLILRNPFY
jgi:hypothetical protein